MNKDHHHQKEEIFYGEKMISAQIAVFELDRE